jgi:hypothetical protein
MTKNVTFEAGSKTLVLISSMRSAFWQALRWRAPSPTEVKGTAGADVEGVGPPGVAVGGGGVPQDGLVTAGEEKRSTEKWGSVSCLLCSSV